MLAKYSETKIKYMSQIAFMACAVLLMTALTACTSGSTNWQHPTKPKNTWAADISACKSHANSLVNRQLDIDNDSSFRTPDDLEVQFAVHDARKKRYSYFTNCLTGKGYRQETSK